MIKGGFPATNSRSAATPNSIRSRQNNNEAGREQNRGSRSSSPEPRRASELTEPTLDQPVAAARLAQRRERGQPGLARLVELALRGGIDRGARRRRSAHPGRRAPATRGRPARDSTKPARAVQLVGRAAPRSVREVGPVVNISEMLATAVNAHRVRQQGREPPRPVRDVTGPRVTQDRRSAARGKLGQRARGVRSAFGDVVRAACGERATWAATSSASRRSSPSSRAAVERGDQRRRVANQVSSRSSRPW